MIFYIFVFIFGAIIGSFLNVCIYRIPKGLSIVFPSSRCISCGSMIRFYDNIPIISYLVLRGRCRNCRAGISGIYPLVEFLNAILYVLTVYKSKLLLRLGQNPTTSPTAISPPKSLASPPSAISILLTHSFA